MDQVCAVVVTYNRKALLLSCLEALGKQSYPLAAIYIIDNASTDGTKELLYERGIIGHRTESPSGEEESSSLWQKGIQLHYLRLPENVGGAGGFHYGVKYATARGYDFLWLLDDDGLPGRDALFHLMEKNLPHAVLCSLVVDGKNPEKLSFGLKIHGQYYYRVAEVQGRADASHLLRKNTGNFFNSILLPRKIVETVGFPDKELFLWGDELDYFYRILKHGFEVITVTDSIHYHPCAAANFAPWKQYYMVRNIVVLWKRYHFFKPMIVPLRALLKIFLLYALTGRNTRLILRGLWDGVRHRLGKTLDPALWMKK